MKKITILIGIACILLFCTSCYQNGASHSYADAYSSSKQKSTTSGWSNENDKNTESKIIYSAQLNLTVKIPDSANNAIKEITKKYNGYVSQLGTTKTIIRIKSNHLNEAIEDITKLGRVDNKRINGQDVTSEYLDYQIRLENAEKARERYLELLAKAETVEAALLVEKELERLNQTIDLMKGKMNSIDHLSEFSTITIYLKEKKKLGLLGYVGVGVYRSVKWLFVRN